MRFQPTKLSGAFIVEMEPHEDSRGFFARSFCAQEFAAQGLASVFVQSSISYNRQRGTLRGLHYQLPPAAEIKLVRCTAGAIYDVIVDLRPGSPTYRQHLGVELTARNRRALYVPEMFAHGLQTLADETEVLYLINAFHKPDKAIGIRYNEPKLGIPWPLPATIISDRDAGWPLLV